MNAYIWFCCSVKRMCMDSYTSPSPKLLAKSMPYTNILRMKPFAILILAFFFCKSFGQTSALYIPVTINSPLFFNDENKEIQVGTKINNFGVNVNAAGQLNKKILIVNIQYNNGKINFDPLHFKKYYSPGKGEQLIQSYPSEMFYAEMGLGYNFKLHSQKLCLIAGIGQQFQNTNTRYFLQLDLGHEGRLVNAGASLRGNYTVVNHVNLITLEPVLQWKAKIWKLRFVNQFGYSIAIIRKHDYMKPILTIGLEYNN